MNRCKVTIKTEVCGSDVSKTFIAEGEDSKECILAKISGALHVLHDYGIVGPLISVDVSPEV